MGAMATALDPYAALGVSPTATHAEIDEAYRRGQLLLHPDRTASRSKAEQETAAELLSAVLDARTRIVGADHSMARHRSQNLTSNDNPSTTRTGRQVRPTPALSMFVGAVAATALFVPPPALAQATAAPGTGRTATRDLGPPKYDRPLSARATKICDGTAVVKKKGVIKITVNYAKCDQAIWDDINAAHRSEHIPPRAARPVSRS